MVKHLIYQIVRLDYVCQCVRLWILGIHLEHGAEAMKCVALTNSDGRIVEIVRIEDHEAFERVKLPGWWYCDKRLWKRQVRDGEGR